MRGYDWHGWNPVPATAGPADKSVPMVLLWRWGWRVGLGHRRYKAQTQGVMRRVDLKRKGQPDKVERLGCG